MVIQFFNVYTYKEHSKRPLCRQRSLIGVNAHTMDGDSLYTVTYTQWERYAR